MWNRRKDEENPPRPTTTPTPAAPAAPIQPREAQPQMSSMPMRSYEPAPSSGSAATIGKGVNVKGQILSREDLVIDGEVEGTVEAHDHRITIGPNGRVHAGVKAREIVVHGTIQGNVEAADKIDIKKDAKLVGDIKTARIVIEDGAYFKGSIDITKPDAKPQPKHAAAPAAAAPDRTPPPAAASGS